MKLFNSGKKKAVVAVAVGAVVIGSGAAYAYFTSTGSGEGSAAVGSASHWTVAVDPASGGSLLPGSGTDTLTYTITNPSDGHQNLSGTTAEVKQDGAGNIISGTTAVAGCLASWFTVTNNGPTLGDVAGHGSVSGSATVSLDNAAANQDACQGKAPVLVVSAN